MSRVSKSTQKGMNTMNAIYNSATDNYRQIVPKLLDDGSNLTQIGNVILDDAYKPVLNEFVSTLINRIALTIVRNKSFNNPLSIFKKGSVPLGTDIQEIYTNPANKKPYEYSNSAMAELLTIEDPDTHVAYYRRNVMDKYPVTFSREGLQGAFVSWDKFNDFITSITQSLYSGCYIDDFKYTKGVFDSLYNSGKAIFQVVNDVTDETSGKAFTKILRKLYLDMTFPSTEYNAFSKINGKGQSVTTWTTADRICVILTSDVNVELSVEVLAYAFNMDKADLMGRVFVVDKFDNPELKGAIFDEAFLQIYDNLFRMDEFYNASTMSWKDYLHRWSTYGASPFANAVLLVTGEPTPATNIEFATPTVEVQQGSQQNVTLTVTPTSATSEINYTVENENIATVEKTDDKNCKVTGVVQGQTKLIATSDNGLTAEATINVTAGA